MPPFFRDLTVTHDSIYWSYNRCKVLPQHPGYSAAYPFNMDHARDIYYGETRPKRPLNPDIAAFINSSHSITHDFGSDPFFYTTQKSIENCQTLIDGNGGLHIHKKKTDKHVGRFHSPFSEIPFTFSKANEYEEHIYPDGRIEKEIRLLEFWRKFAFIVKQIVRRQQYIS
jgi:hypothetical protein